MKHLPLIYSAAIVIILFSAGNELWKDNKKFISLLTYFVAIVTGFFAFQKFRGISY